MAGTNIIPMRATMPRPQETRGAAGMDYARPDPEALDVKRLENWLQEIREQPPWRLPCDRDADYYDGHQLTAEMLEKMREKGFPAIKENLVRPTIDAVLGLEAKSRTDWLVRHEHDRWEEVAMALSVKMKEAEREAKADRACSDAFAAEVKSGLGWVEVSRELVPNAYPYRVQCVHRREIAWDWREQDPERWRYLVRRKWFDEDVVMAMFPSRKELIQRLSSGFAGWWDDVIRTQDTDLAESYELQRTTSIEQYEYMDHLRKRLCLYEIWYRVWKAAAMIRTPDKRLVEFDRKNPDHVNAIALGLVQPEIRPLAKVRLAFFVGPHRLIDVPSPYKHRFFPYVPFFGYREDRSGAPYGLVRSMRDQQDEVNARKAKMMWLLSAKRVRADEDAVDDHQVAKDEIARPDAYIVLSKTRRTGSTFEVDDNMQLSDQQFKIYESAKKSLQDVAGVYQALLGQAGAAESGIAINQLIEQGTTTLAEIMDNYRYARRQVGELLCELVKEDIANGETVMVGEGEHRHEVTLNEATEDEFGPTVKNDVTRAGTKVVLDDIPSTPTYRAQLLKQLSEITKSLPENLQAIIIDFIIEATDLPNRQAIAERIRAAQGLKSNKPPKNAAERQAQEAAIAAQQKAAELQERDAEAEVRGKELANDKLELEIAEIARGATGEADAATAESQQIQQVLAEAQETIKTLTEEIARLDAALSKQTDAEIRAAVEIAKSNLEAQRADSVKGLIGRLEKLEAGAKPATKKPAAKPAAKPKTKEPA